MRKDEVISSPILYICIYICLEAVAPFFVRSTHLLVLFIVVPSVPLRTRNHRT